MASDWPQRFRRYDALSALEDLGDPSMIDRLDAMAPWPADSCGNCWVGQTSVRKGREDAIAAIFRRAWIENGKKS